MTQAPNDNHSDVLFDIVIVGSGFAGTILARVLNASGRKVLLLEKGHHPRFALGESSTPLAALCLERLAERYGLPDLRHLATYGRWRQHLPHLRHGLKRGFTFYQHKKGKVYRNSAVNEARLLVAASPDDHLADCHWLRQDVDHHLLRQALREGVQYLDGVELSALEITEREIRLGGRQQNWQRDQKASRKLSFRARHLVDASGPNGFATRPGHPVSEVGGTPHEVGGTQRSLLYAHFRNLPPFSQMAPEAEFPAGPYPDEQAAVHHLLREGWMYQLPFDHGITSCGLVLRKGTLPTDLQNRPEAAWREILRPYPSLSKQFAHALPTTPIRYRHNMPYGPRSAKGERISLLPHTYAFADPIFSTGMAWSLFGVERLAQILSQGSSSDSLDRIGKTSAMRAHADLLRREARQVDSLVEAAYLAMHDFPLFTAVAYLYFVTVSFAEVEARLAGPKDTTSGTTAGGEREAWTGFLGAQDPRIVRLFEQSLGRLRGLGQASSKAQREEFLAWLDTSLAGWNIAGLGDPARCNLYPVDLQILVDRSALLGLSREEMIASLPKLRGEP